MNWNGDACSTHGGEARRSSSGGGTRGRRPRGIIRHRRKENSERMLKKEDGGMKWIYLAQDWGKWRDILKAVLNLWVT